MQKNSTPNFGKKLVKSLDFFCVTPNVVDKKISGNKIFEF